MFSEKEKQDLEQFVKMGEKQAGKLSSMIITNFFVDLLSEKQTERTYSEIVEYLRKKRLKL